MLANIAGAAGSAFLGGAINDVFNKAAADRSYEMNRRLQKHDQAFQKEMRATAYQTMVEDMEKAGLNPAVAMSNGAGQAMGGSSSASASAPSGGGTDLAKMMEATALTQAQKENIEADTELKEKQSGKTESEIKLNQQRVKIDKAIADAEIALKTAQTKKEKATAEQTWQIAINAKIKNMYEGMYGREMPKSILDWVSSRVYQMVIQTGGSTTGLEPIINELIEQYGDKKNKK